MLLVNCHLPLLSLPLSQLLYLLSLIITPQSLPQSELGSVGDESERDGDGSGGVGRGDKLCNNCTVPANFLHSTAKGMQCLTCYNHWKRNGTLRPTVGPLKRDRQLIKHKRHPPPGMYINHEVSC